MEIKAHLVTLFAFGYCIWTSAQENLSSVFADNKGVDQPAHLCSLISAFVICSLESMISNLATSKFSIF